MRIKTMTVALLLLVPGIMLFVLTATASAGSLNGTYVGTGSGSSLFALCGFDETGFPQEAELGAYETMTLNTEGYWTFRPDGSGTAEVVTHVISLANPDLDSSFNAPGLRFPWFGENTARAEISYDFDAKTGQIDITAEESESQWIGGPLAGQSIAQLPTPFFVGSGIVSQDRKSIKFNTSSTPRSIGITICNSTGDPAQIVEHLSSTLIRQDQAPHLLPPVR